MKYPLFSLCAFLCLLLGGRVSYAQQKVSILGDSYSTFYGYVTPDTNLCWYGVPGEKKENDVSQVDETTRMSDLGQPDIILVFGGTNDSWAGVPIGNYQYADWEKEDLYEFRPALCCLMDFLVTNYSNALIYYITNTELSEPVSASIDEVCRHYGITNIRLHDIDKQWGHPSVQGMKSICEQVGAVVAQRN